MTAVYDFEVAEFENEVSLLASHQVFATGGRPNDIMMTKSIFTILVRVRGD